MPGLIGNPEEIGLKVAKGDYFQIKEEDKRRTVCAVREEGRNWQTNYQCLIRMLDKIERIYSVTWFAVLV